jgi:DNA-binding FrmR family transcriptional regulator
VTEELAPCGCATGDRRAVEVDPEIKRSVLNRLKRIEGQIRGLQRMVEEERYCADVITQVSSVQEALRSTAKSLLHNHLKHCATQALRSGDSAQAESMYSELMELMGRVN